MNKGALIAAVICCLLISAGALYAAQRGVQVRLSGQELFEVAPQNVVTTTFAVTNTSREELEFMPRVTLPEGWKFVTPSLPFRIGPGRTEIRLVSFFIPQTALARKYKIIYRVNSVKYPSISDFATIYAAVLSITKLQAQLLKAPESVIAGEDYNAVFSVINASNRENRVVIKVKSGQGLPYAVVPDKLTLAPGESKNVKVTVKTDEKLTKSFKHILKFTVQSVEDEKMKGQTSCAVDIIPRVTGVVDRFHKIPSKIVLRSLAQRGEEDNIQFQGEFSGEGKLSEDGEDEIAFMFRGPDTLEDNSMFGQHDRYFTAYRGEDAAVLLGDGYYSLSKLTEQSLDARGAEAGSALGDFGLRGYYMKTRWRKPALKEAALHFDYLFQERYTIGFNLFNKKNDLQDAQIASLQGKLVPFENTNFEFEFAYGRDEAELELPYGKNGKTHDKAYWLNLYGSRDWATYFVEYIYAGPDFPGYYRDKEYISGNFVFPIIAHLTLNATLRQEKSNLNSGLSSESASIERYGVLGLNYMLSTGTTIALESRGRSREDRFPDPNYDYRELTLKARLVQNFKRCFFNISAELGKTEDRLTNETTEVGIYEGTAYFMPTSGQTYGGYVRYTNRGDPDNLGKDVVNAGLTGSLRLGRTTNIKLKLDKYEYLGTDSGDRNMIDVWVSQSFLNNWIASAHARHTLYSSSSDQRNETAFIVELTIPLGLPVGRKKGIGMLEGYVRDQATGEPITNAILRLSGATAVTDSDGEFSFPALKPGTFYLNVDRASIGLERIPVQKTPLEVSIKGGSEESLEIGITKSADLTGRVVVYEFAKKDGLQKGFTISKGKEKGAGEEGKDKMVEDRGLGNAVLEFVSAVETWRVLTDRKGRFSFDDVRPGEWTLMVHVDSMPQYHYLEKNKFEIELAPGDKKEMVIRILPRKRTIQIIEEGGTVIEEEEEK